MNKLCAGKELGDALGISRNTITKLRVEGKIPFYQYGNRFRYCIAEVKEALKVKGGEPTCKK